MKISLIIWLILLFSIQSSHAKRLLNLEESEIYKTANLNIEKYRKTDFSIQLEGIKKSDLKDIQIEVKQTSHDFLFGCIIFDLVSDRIPPEDLEEYKNRFKNIFNLAVFPFYWSSYEKEPGKTNQKKMMEVVSWCNENNITTKGHPLVWTHKASTPKWLNNFSTAESKKLLQKRIENIVSEYKGEVDIWDVINEVIQTINWDEAMVQNKAGIDERYLKKNLMSEKIAFIDSCFQWAYQANPEAHLMINEFGIVTNEEERQQFYKTIKALLKQKTPISGIGLQVHEPYQGRYYYSPKQLWQTFETYAKFNLPLHVTELTPVSNGDTIKGDYKTGMWTEKAQADIAEMVFTLSFGHPALHSVNCWGFSDKSVWQKNCGLVDENLQPKEIYKRLDKLINKDWNTHISDLKPNKKGKVNFRGFKGNYTVTVLKNGNVMKKSKLDYSDQSKKLIISF